MPATQGDFCGAAQAGRSTTLRSMADQQRRYFSSHSSRGPTPDWVVCSHVQGVSEWLCNGAWASVGLRYISCVAHGVVCVRCVLFGSLWCLSGGWGRLGAMRLALLALHINVGRRCACVCRLASFSYAPLVAFGAEGSRARLGEAPAYAQTLEQVVCCTCFHYGCRKASWCGEWLRLGERGLLVHGCVVTPSCLGSCGSCGLFSSRLAGRSRGSAFSSASALDGLVGSVCVALICRQHAPHSTR